MDRASIAKRIAALLQKTTERGCTEAEALSAAAKAAELMREYGITSEDIEFSEQATSSKTRGNNVAARLWSTVAHCTNTAAIVLQGATPSDTKVSFLGKEPGPQIACYLFTLLTRAITHEVGKFKLSTFYRRRRTLVTRRQAVSDFTLGLVHRLNARLLDTFGPVLSDEEKEAADRALALRYPAAQTVERKTPNIRFNDALGEGWDAANKVQLSRGLGGGAAPLAIGGAK